MHGEEAVAHEPEGHQRVGGALVFDEAIDVAVAPRGLERIEDVGAGGTQGRFDEEADSRRRVERSQSARRGRGKWMSKKSRAVPV